MHYFFAPNILNNQSILDEEESLHLSKVLRLKEGEEVFLMNGKGGIFKGTILRTHAKQSLIGSIELVEQQRARRVHLHIALVPTKQMERFEWFLEKAVELGIEEITPITSNRGYRFQVKEERLMKIVLSAMKQSKNAFLPKLNPVTKLSNFVVQQRLETCFIAHCEESNKVSWSTCVSSSEKLCLLIGPEGDFTQEEIESSILNGFQPVHLGTSRLRTETAGIYAAASVRSYIENDLS